MKLLKPISIIIILLIFNSAYSISGELSQDLKERLNSLKEDEYISCLVMFKDQIKPKDLELNRLLKTLPEKHSSIIYKLRDKKEKAQSDILKYLEEQKSNGSVKSYRSFWIVNGLLVTATKEEIEKIALRPEVEIVSPNYPVSLIAPVSEQVNSSKAGVIDYFQVIGVRELWKMGYTGKGRLVCGFDTGVEGSHPALFSNWKGGLQGGDGSEWYDPYGSSFPVDANGHGTHTMGIMAGKTTAETLGVAFGARWIAAGIIDRGRSFDETIADILQAFEWAIDPDGNPATIDDVPDVINNSWGIPLAAKPPCDQTFWSAIDNVEAAGIVVVFAAGNEGPSNSSIRTPADRATSPTNSFSAGAVDAQVYGFPIASFSSRGPSGCDNITIKPEICAPGVSIRSSYLNGTYKALSGTSTAAPFVSGAVALLREFNPEATVEEIKNALLVSSTDLGLAGEDNDYGWGLLNLKKALDFLPPPPFPKVWLDSVYVEKDTLVYPDGRIRSKIYLVLKNYGEGADSLSLILKTMDSSVAIIEDSLYFDSIGSKMIEVNVNSPLIVSYGNNLPLDYPVIFYLKLYNGSQKYVDSLQFSVILHPVSNHNLGEHDIGNVTFTISNSGRYGLGDGTIAPSGGKGFRFPKSGEDNLFEGAFLVGKSKEQVMDAARDGNSKSSENDFEPEGLLTISTPGVLSDQDGIGIFSDSGAENRIGVEIVQKSFAFANPPDDDYVILEFNLKNKTSDTLRGIYPGLFFDWDINLFSPKDDLAGRDSISNIPIVYQYDSTSSVYLTIFPLNHPPASYKLIDNQLYLYDGFTEEMKYLFLSGDALIASDTASILYKGDWSIISSCGPFNIPPEESIMVGFAVAAGNSLLDLKENVRSAKIKYYDLRTEVESPEEHLVPTDYSLGQNYPNPFNPATTIPFCLKVQGSTFKDPLHTTLIIYNILGQKVRTLVDENKLPGRYVVIWDGKDEKCKEVSSGIYFYRLETSGFKETKKMILLR
jgi:subtilisin family serine protease